MMFWTSVCLIVVVQSIYVGGLKVNFSKTPTCRSIKQADPYAESGVYALETAKTGKKIQAYCEMGLDNGGFTFISSKDLQQITNDDIQAMFTDKTTFLMRIRKCNNQQPFVVLKQLAQYRHFPLKLGLSEHGGYAAPVNYNWLGCPYLYFGFVPTSHSTNRNPLGFWANGREYTYKKCDNTPASYFALFANYQEKQPTGYGFGREWPLFHSLFSSAKINPSKREMPVEYFYFTEIHFGGCGGYAQTDSRLNNRCIESFAIGFR